MIQEELTDFFQFFEIDNSRADKICKYLESKQLVASKSQLFLLEDKSWKHVLFYTRL